jgi:hypothetical protein
LSAFFGLIIAKQKATGWIILPVASEFVLLQEVSGRAMNGHANENAALNKDTHET